MNKTLLLTNIFVKKDVLKLQRILLVVLPLLAGGTIIVGNSALSHQFDNHMVYYMYSYIAQYLLLYFAVAYWGVEFQKKTVNLLAISGQSYISLYISKAVAYLFHVLVFFFFAFLEIALYLLAKGTNISIRGLFVSMLGSYLMYGGFIFACSTIIVFISKNIVITLAASWMLMSIVPAISMLLQSFPVAKYLQYIPFSFIVEVFNFSNFTLGQLAITMLWIILLNIIGYFLLKKRGRI